MGTAANPFKPTAGATPPLLIGRAPVLEAYASSLTDGPGSPGRLSIFTGARGVGKTVLLNEVEDISLKHGWVGINETASPGLIGRLEQHVTLLLEGRRPRPRRSSLESPSPAVVGSLCSQLRN